MLWARWVSGAFCLLWLGTTPVARGDFWYEIGDAGNTPATAQITTTGGPLQGIIGTIRTAYDTDVYAITVTDPELFSITMDGTNLSWDNDTQLWLMDAAANLIAFDDDSGPGWLSQMNVGVLSGYEPGRYLVAYNLYDSTAIGTGPITGWTTIPDWSQTGRVQLNFTGAAYAVSTSSSPGGTPEPGGLILLGLGLLSVGGHRWLRRRRLQTAQGLAARSS